MNKLQRCVGISCLLVAGVLSSGCGGEEAKPANNAGTQATPEMEKMRDDMMKSLPKQAKSKTSTPKKG